MDTDTGFQLFLLTDEELYILRLILKLRREKGWGYYRIGKFLVEKGVIRKRSFEASKKWVMRFIRRIMKRLEVSSEDELYNLVFMKDFKTRGRDMGHLLGQKASSCSGKASTPTGGGVVEVPRVEDLVQYSGDSLDKYKRLGRTERLVLAVMSIFHRAVTPRMILDMIRKEFPLYGSTLSRGAVIQALRRLVKRGLVRRLYHPERNREGKIVWVRSTGYYELVYASPLLVENFRVDGSWIWSKETMGKPAPLNHALALASIFNRYYPVESIELKIYVDGRVRDVAEKLRRMGWTYTAIYYDVDEDRVNVEARFHYPPVKAHPLYMEQYRRLYMYAVEVGLKAISSALASLGNGYVPP